MSKKQYETMSPMKNSFLNADGSIIDINGNQIQSADEKRAELYKTMSSMKNGFLNADGSITLITGGGGDYEELNDLKNEITNINKEIENLSVVSFLPVGTIIESIDSSLSDNNSDFLECDGREITTKDYPSMQGLLTKKSDILALSEKYLATASDMYSGTYEPWLSFDGSFTTGYNRGWLRGATSVGENIYIQRKFLEPVKWERVCINQGGSDAVYPKEILFKGSHDGVNWFTLGKSSFPKVQYTNMYYEFEENLDEYTYYRACIMSHHAGGSWGTGINEMWFDTSSTKVGHLPNISKYSDGTNEIHTYIKVK